MNRIIVVAVAPLFTLLGCGAFGLSTEGGDSSCMTAEAHTCQDSLGQSALTETALKTSCPANGGVFGDDVCDHTGALGGCEIDEAVIMAGASLVTWYFAGAVSGTTTINTKEDVMSICPNMGDTSFVEP